MSKGYVYILTNPSMPGLLKIGKTTRSVQQRCNELWQTGVPTPFTVRAEVFTPDCHGLELSLHEQFAKQRVSESREFFALDERIAADALECGMRRQVQEIVDEFIPDHRVIEEDMAVEEADILHLAQQLDAHPFEVVSAMEFMQADELVPALNRWRERVRIRSEAMKAGNPLPDLKAPSRESLQ